MFAEPPIGMSGLGGQLSYVEIGNSHVLWATVVMLMEYAHGTDKHMLFYLCCVKSHEADAVYVPTVFRHRWDATLRALLLTGAAGLNCVRFRELSQTHWSGWPWHVLRMCYARQNQ